VDFYAIFIEPQRDGDYHVGMQPSVEQLSSIVPALLTMFANWNSLPRIVRSHMLLNN
jgi:hypothetical protein